MSYYFIVHFCFEINFNIFLKKYFITIPKQYFCHLIKLHFQAAYFISLKNFYRSDFVLPFPLSPRSLPATVQQIQFARFHTRNSTFRAINLLDAVSREAVETTRYESPRVKPVRKTQNLILAFASSSIVASDSKIHPIILRFSFRSRFLPQRRSEKFPAGR